MKNTNTDLKNLLFETLEGLLDYEKPLELDRAKVISEVAQTMVNATKVEIDLVRLKVDAMKLSIKGENMVNPNALNIPFLEPKKDEDYLEEKRKDRFGGIDETED